MITVTDAAKPELARFFEVYDKAPMRICVLEACGGISLDMILDAEDPANDQLFTVGDFSFVVENDLAAILGPITVDLVDGDFKVSSRALDAQQAKQGCGCGCGGGKSDGPDSPGAACGCGDNPSDTCGCGESHSHGGNGCGCSGHQH